MLRGVSTKIPSSSHEKEYGHTYCTCDGYAQWNTVSNSNGYAENNTEAAPDSVAAISLVR
jgi:hypothetical protein